MRIARLIIGALGVVLVACNDGGSDGSSGAANCGAFSACGGDPSGTWQIEDVCYGRDVLAALEARINLPTQCTNVVSGLDTRPAGTFVFGQAGAASLDITLALDLEMRLSSPCLAALGAAGMEAAVCAQSETSLAMNPDYEGASCDFAGGACTCLVSSVPMPVMSSGALTVMGNALYDGADADEFCVEGDTLTIRNDTSLGTGILRFRRMP